ncbi:MAG: exo-alpha-sialidase [Acidimicrobiia bacterium]|nr:exo-alpha-sialidase [Acidimicrobiia bacterium]
MKVIDGGVVYPTGRKPERRSCAFPSICVSASRRWLCAFRAAPAKFAVTGQHPLLTWSDDEGGSWTEPIAPFSPVDIEGRPGNLRGGAITALPNGTLLAAVSWIDQSDPSLPFYNPETEGLLDTRILLFRSLDDGASWSAPVLVDTTPFKVPTPLTGPILWLSNGHLALQVELNKHYRDTSVWKHSSVLMFSRDEGHTWPEHTITSNDPTNRVFYWDQRPGVLADGRLLDVFWTYDNGNAVYLNIHARVSDDHGRSWSPMCDTGVPGQPAPPVSLPDGRIGLVYVDRTSTPTIKMRASEDGGHTWPQASEIVLHSASLPTQSTLKAGMNDAWSEMAKFSVGLPTTALTQDGDIVVTFYTGSHCDETSIHWVRVRG